MFCKHKTEGRASKNSFVCFQMSPRSENLLKGLKIDYTHEVLTCRLIYWADFTMHHELCQNNRGPIILFWVTVYISSYCSSSKRSPKCPKTLYMFAKIKRTLDLSDNVIFSFASFTESHIVENAKNVCTYRSYLDAGQDSSWASETISSFEW